MLVTAPNYGLLSGNCGYDDLYGKCGLVECHPSERGHQLIDSGLILDIIGIGVPFLIMFISYSIVYSIVSKVEVTEDVSTKQFKISTIVLTGCYVVFILPVCIVELIPDSNVNKGLIYMAVYTWFWNVFIVNVFIYAIYLPRCREAICIMFKDVFTTFLPHTKIRSNMNNRSRDDSTSDRGIRFSNAVETKYFT